MVYIFESFYSLHLFCSDDLNPSSGVIYVPNYSAAVRHVVNDEEEDDDEDEDDEDEVIDIGEADHDREEGVEENDDDDVEIVSLRSLKHENHSVPGTPR